MSAASDLTSENVEAIFLDGLATSIDPPESVLIAAGITKDVRFNSERLFTHVPDVELMLSHASELFYEDRGAGHTCSELAFRRDGRRWGTRRDVERLVALGIAMHMVSYSRSDRAEWVLFPEGTPYVRVKGSLFRLWAVFTSGSGLTLTVPFKPELYPPARRIDEAVWYEPRELAVAKMGDNPRHAGEAFYLDIVVRGFFEEQLPSWILDPGTLLQVY